ncbi:MAG: hypothetical protein IKD97_00540, partial [Firmicutes bacterium]|nr:hypothetical protein [Bacillota bacterium]
DIRVRREEFIFSPPKGSKAVNKSFFIYFMSFRHCVSGDILQFRRPLGKCRMHPYKSIISLYIILFFDIIK